MAIDFTSILSIYIFPINFIQQRFMELSIRQDVSAYKVEFLNNFQSPGRK